MRDLERLSAELEGFRARPTFLGACTVCPMLREELSLVWGELEKWTAPPSICEDCLAYRIELAACKAEVRRLEN